MDSCDFDFADPDAPNSCPANPSPEEYEFLLDSVNLSPQCGAEYCQDFDFEAFQSLNVDVMIMHGYRQSVWALSETNVTEIERITGRTIVYIDISLRGPNCTEGNENLCAGKSMLEVIQQYEQLALALGINPPKSLQGQKERMYDAAANFQDVARTVANRGVRIMAAYLAPQGGGDFGDSNYFANPTNDLVLRMLEELGLPLLHVNCNQAPDEEACPLGYFWETVQTPKYFGGCEGDLAGCADNVMYPVDFWLYDHRTTLYVTDPSFRDVFPDKAIELGQMGYWPIGAGTISHEHAAEILELLAVSLRDAQRIHPATDCKTVDVSSDSHRTVGLAGGEYACFEEKFHNQAYFGDLESGMLNGFYPTTGLSTGVVVGISLGVALAIFLVVGIVVVCKKKAANEKQADTGVKQGLEIEAPIDMTRVAD